MKKKILIIENDADIRNVVTFILQQEGYEVRGSSYTSTDLLHANADLIVLDEWINKREGHMLCKEIKAIEMLNHIPVIIFSTAMDIADIAKVCLADGFVHKPFEIDALITEVKKFLPLPAIV